ncbi:MAG: hypothetical protein V8S14_00935 [Lachnospiraceae bacterium]
MSLILYHNRGKGERGYDEEKRQSIVTCISGYPYCSSGSVVQAADTSTKVQNTQAVKAEAQSLEVNVGNVEGLKPAKVNMNVIAKEARSSNDAIGDVPYTYAKTGLEKWHKVQ